MCASWLGAHGSLDGKGPKDHVGKAFGAIVAAPLVSTPYSWTFTAPMRYYTRTEGEEGGNTTVVLTGHAFFDADEPSIFNSSLVCTLTDAELGTAVS